MSNNVQQPATWVTAPPPLSRSRPHGRVVRCLPGLCEPYPFCPPGEPPRCRHCETLLEREETL